jgi:hypothetical protein
MNLDLVSNTRPSLPPINNAAIPGRSVKAAREFEANLIASLLQSLESAFATLPGQDGLPGSDDYSYLGCQALSEGVAERGGFGIARMILQHLP